MYIQKFSTSIYAQWIAEVRKPSHHGKVQSLRDGEGASAENIETLLGYGSTTNPNVPNKSPPAEMLSGRKIRLPIDVVLRTRMNVPEIENEDCRMTGFNLLTISVHQLKH
ncbi:hypothetical protein T265_03872 [Opisthorchis viverrini]|uniref:Uncharacterized protein n=1 Tax=Opisthorchis viverrini TaxID=6198 RepID=A0A075AH95_OPIVI|nr:hypothetical protein T265_03872 [Opisthorchis viverrini]KER29494.1 hypothetical protein T265_03872 [Opisthorchis viverrini]